MPATHESTMSLTEQVNQLYWETGATVDEIVHGLGIGRSTLYSVLSPLPAGTPCTDCGEELVFTNRTGRDHGTATCRTCGTHSSLGSTGGDAAADAGEGEPRRDGASGWSRWREELAAVPAERAAIVGGAAALGIVVGAAATRAVRDRL